MANDGQKDQTGDNALAENRRSINLDVEGDNSNTETRDQSHGIPAEERRPFQKGCKDRGHERSQGNNTQGRGGHAWNKDVGTRKEKRLADARPKNQTQVGAKSVSCRSKSFVAIIPEIKTEFIVIDTPSPCNIILGRPWLHTMGAVPSTLHQLLRFPTEHGIEEVRGDQLQAENCSMAAMKSTCSIREPEKVEIENEDIEVLNDVGKEPTERSEEALKILKTVGKTSQQPSRPRAQPRSPEEFDQGSSRRLAPRSLKAKIESKKLENDTGNRNMNVTGNRELTRECEWNSCKALGVYELMEPEPQLGVRCHLFCQCSPAGY
ncbi:hypothetical protein HYC85_030638 [Camellia sinensis]|uniref:Uncharacterized protein n=1 Tax=Camellia sinensis TaxID=4442 RepID=A0A7J7G1W1_CAMSI|nr:hypothetical protein HYC85_030638 [Camellia sinensis]